MRSSGACAPSIRGRSRRRRCDGAQLRIYEAEVAAAGNGPVPGTILGADAAGIVVMTGDQALALLRVQLPGRRAVARTRARQRARRSRARCSSERARAAPDPRRRGARRGRGRGARPPPRGGRRRGDARRPAAPGDPVARLRHRALVLRARGLSRAPARPAGCEAGSRSARAGAGRPLPARCTARRPSTRPSRRPSRRRASSAVRARPGLVNALLRRFQREREAILAAAHGGPRRAPRAPGMAARRLRARLAGALGVDRGRRQCRAADVAARQRAARHARRLSRAARGRGARGRALRIRAGGAAARASRSTSARCPALRTATFPCRTRPRSSRRVFWRAAPGMRVLDACAAPGGKACHLLELDAGLASSSRSTSTRRARRASSRISRAAACRRRSSSATARVPAAWWDGRPFDRILLDVPCSGTGVIRRHPDIKLLRRAGDIARFAAKQAALLRACLACWRRAAGSSTRVARC